MDGPTDNVRLLGAEYYRLRARLARKLGKKATTEAGKLWLLVAERYEAIADELDRRRAS